MYKHTPEFIEIMNRYKDALRENRRTKVNINQILDERNKELLKQATEEENDLMAERNRYEGVDNKAIMNRLKMESMNKKKGQKMHLKSLLMVLDKEKENQEDEDPFLTENTVKEREINKENPYSFNSRKNLPLIGQSSYLTELSGTNNVVKLPKICKIPENKNLATRNVQVNSNVDLLFNSPAKTSHKKLNDHLFESRLNLNSSETNLINSLDKSNSKLNYSKDYYRSISRVMSQQHTMEVLRVIVNFILFFQQKQIKMREILNNIKTKETNIILTNEATRMRIDKRKKKESEMQARLRLLLQGVDQEN